MRGDENQDYAYRIHFVTEMQNKTRSIVRLLYKETGLLSTSHHPFQTLAWKVALAQENASPTCPFLPTCPDISALIS